MLPSVLKEQHVDPIHDKDVPECRQEKVGWMPSF